MRRTLLWPVICLAFVFFVAACSSRDDEALTPRPTLTSGPAQRTATPGPAATAPPQPTAPVRTLVLGAPTPPPRNSSLFIVTGCNACDGPDETLQVHSTNAAGTTTVTTVMGPGHPKLEGMTIGGFEAAADGTVLAVAACRADYCGGLGNHPVKDWRVLVSVNGGVDWTTAYEERINYVYVSDASIEGIVVSSVHSDGVSLSAIAYTAVNLAGRQRKLAIPSAAGRLARPILLPRGLIAWMAASDLPGEPHNKFFREDGAEIPVQLPQGASIASAEALQDGSLALRLYRDQFFLALYPAAGGAPRAVINLGETSLHGVFPDGSGAVANNFVSGPGPNQLGPVLINFDTLSATPLTTAALAKQPGRNRFIAIDFNLN